MPDDKSIDDKLDHARDQKRLSQHDLKHVTELHAPKGTKKAKAAFITALKRSRARWSERIAKLRKKKHEAADKGGSVRQRIVANAIWGCDNEPSIHYEQSRPIDGHGTPRKLPLDTDCSGFATDCYEWADAPDPNGFNFNGYGYTGTILSACKHIPKADALPGDLVVHGAAPGTHVTVLIEPGTVADPLVVSHGQEAGPFKVRNSVEISAHAGQPVTYCRAI